jgi:hypothetical protein
MEIPTVMVCMAENNRAWTLDAVHLACALARNTGMEITLVKLLPVTQPAWLGTELGYERFTKEDRDAIRFYGEVAQDYAVSLTVGIVQYITRIDAIVETADSLNAPVVFATFSSALIPLWRRYQLWELNRRLTHHHHRLYTLEPPRNFIEWRPSVMVLPAKK